MIDQILIGTLGIINTNQNVQFSSIMIKKRVVQAKTPPPKKKG